MGTDSVDDKTLFADGGEEVADSLIAEDVCEAGIDAEAEELYVGRPLAGSDDVSGPELIDGEIFELGREDWLDSKLETGIEEDDTRLDGKLEVGIEIVGYVEIGADDTLDGKLEAGIEENVTTEMGTDD
jgi:hypothetical protein